MELGLRQEISKYNKTVFRGNITHEETAETIVPDTQPDILRVLDTAASVVMRSKEADTGRVTVSGMINITMIYTPDGTSVCRLESGMPFSVSAAGAEITPESRIIAGISVMSADTVMANPRKVVLRTTISADISCFADADVPIYTGISGDGSENTEKLMKEQTLNVPVTVVEKKFIIADELQMPDDMLQAGDILSKNVSFSDTEFKWAAGKLIIRGTADVKICYMPAAGSPLKAKDYSIDYSQIIEIDCASDKADADITLMPTGVYIESGSQQQSKTPVMMIEINAVAQCIVYCEKKYTYLADAYSNRCAMEVAYGDISFEGAPVYKKSELLYKETLEVPNTAAEVLNLCVTVGSVTCTRENGVIKMRAPLNVCVVYIDDSGALQRTLAVSHAEAEVEQGSAGKCAAACRCMEKPSCTIMANGVMISVPLEFTARCETSVSFNGVTGICCDGSAVPASNAASVIVIRTDENDSLWNLGKKYNSTARAIMDFNGLPADEAMTSGLLLLIPRVK